ncbi:MAG: hypothetical protein H8E82_02235 [Candidatus Marinimicrobia bacterium]|nr:hypothetical protein [Candidatus Neomarinimicrobiota bacterium]MBL7047173.1 hypothetical protein [Candidatus Neomarinimicrobiota bacterium]
MRTLSGKQSFFLWILALIITLSSVVYQRKTGPTYPVRRSVDIGGKHIQYELLRSHNSDTDAVMNLIVPDQHISGEMLWRRYRSHDEWMSASLEREEDRLIVSVPRQPAAGKVMYKIVLEDGEGKRYELTQDPVIIRFKDPVPAVILIPHILFIFLSMLFSTRTGLEALFKGDKSYRMAIWTIVSLFLGGIIFGPIVQKYAFGAYWTGWPFGHDLTDNKSAVAVIMWLLALWRGKDPARRQRWMIGAAVVQLIVFMIPHSVLGSELDYTQSQ